MDELYFTSDEINQYQTDIINKYFYANNIIENVHIKHGFNGKISIIELIQEFKIIGYEENKNYKIFLNIFGDIFYGIESYAPWNKLDDVLYQRNLILKAFFNPMGYNEKNMFDQYDYLEKKKFKEEKKAILPKIILSYIINQKLLKNYLNNSIDNISTKFDNIISSIINLQSKKHKLEYNLLILQSNLINKNKQIEDQDLLIDSLHKKISILKQSQCRWFNIFNFCARKI